ncbi:hypothetical protein HZA96_05800 [Candidatus Woesearchaeota archaeon]|nr:hypothetical protein [Candidatus Woesearchaeota archaeon]
MNRIEFLKRASGVLAVALLDGLESVLVGNTVFAKEKDSSIHQLHGLDSKEIHLVLFKPKLNDFNTSDEVIGIIEQLAGYPGYWHIEVLYGGKAFGCRPPKCEELTINKFVQRFNGYEVDIRLFNPKDYLNSFSEEAQKRIKEGNFKKQIQRAIDYFERDWADKNYDLFYKNCTDLVFDLSIALGVRKPLIKLDKIDDLKQNEELMTYIASQGISIPRREYLIFPGSYSNLGRFVKSINL